MKRELNEQIQSVADDVEEQLSPIPITLKGTIMALVAKAATNTQTCVSAATEKLKAVGPGGLAEGIKAQNEHVAALNAKLKAQWKAEKDPKKQQRRQRQMEAKRRRNLQRKSKLKKRKKKQQ